MKWVSLSISEILSFVFLEFFSDEEHGTKSFWNSSVLVAKLAIEGWGISAAKILEITQNTTKISLIYIFTFWIPNQKCCHSSDYFCVFIYPMYIVLSMFLSSILFIFFFFKLRILRIEETTKAADTNVKMFSFQNQYTMQIRKSTVQLFASIKYLIAIIIS